MKQGAERTHSRMVARLRREIGTRGVGTLHVVSGVPKKPHNAGDRQAEKPKGGVGQGAEKGLCWTERSRCLQPLHESQKKLQRAVQCLLLIIPLWFPYAKQAVSQCGHFKRTA